MAQPAPPIFPNPTTTPAPVKPPITTLPIAPPKTTVLPISTTTHTKKPPASTTPTPPPVASDPINKDGGAGGMSGGAVAGLVIGILLVLVCSVVGGFMLLKKRRKRMMGRGRYNGYPDTSTSRSRDLKQHDDDDDASESKRQGSGRLWGLVTGMLSKTNKDPASLGGSTTQPSAAAETAAAAVVGPTPPPMQQIQHSHSMRAAGPAPPVPAPNWGTASSPRPPSTLMSNVVTPATPVVGPNYGVNNNGIGSNYPSPGNNINVNSHTLISQPLYLTPTPQDQQLTWKEQQQLQQQQLQQQQPNQQQLQPLQQQQFQHQQQHQQQLQQQLQQQQQQQLQQQQLQQQQQQLQQQHFQQQQQQYQHNQQQQQQQRQLQHMPVQGYGAVVPQAQPSIIVPQQHQSYQQQHPPVQIQHLPRSMALPAAPTPAAQPYYYQPGTGLVSVPLSLPPPEPYTPQPFQPVQAVTVTPSVPHAANNTHYPTSLVSVSHVPPPPTPTQQQPAQQHVQQQQQQQQQQVAYQPPPSLTTQASSLTTAALAAAATPRPVTPESGSIYLPGDSSRLLLSQGLYKIVPDAEDEEEAARAADASTSLAGPTPVLSMDLNLGGDFLSSVLNYSKHPGPSNNTFNSLSPRSTSIVSAEANGGAGESEVQGQVVRHQPGYHDRHAGQKDRPKNQPRFLVDKEEYVAEGHGQNGVLATTTSASTTNGEPVIVGSDIVFEPLPSVKAARARNSLHGGLDSTGSSSSSLLNNNPNNDNQASANGGVKPKGVSSLARAPTLGAFLPTMGTEEYLERTDDKEEYSVRLHGARESSMSPTPTTNVIHPARLGELSKEAQGGIVDISSPIIPNTIVPSSDVDSISTATVTAETVIVPPRSSTPVSPPPLRLSTKPRFT
ncbi:hypothetical protein BGZ95_009749 [Linnemannia exigua]|uniref:Uncharacterized protein n=1 Tax=Linnemannia exigua TaxID=604196 RepID=A0AAD4HBB0_9FUNG|nr:hypothetical protein BGZ95_009749 [Linnemannia exigua]